MKLVLKLAVLVMSVGIVFPTVSNAIPSRTQTKKCSETNAKIIHPANGQAVTFNADCSEIYVLPPVTGKVEVNAIAKTTNLDFCDGVRSVPAIINSLLKSYELMAARLETLVAETEEVDKEIARLEVEELKAKNAYEEADGKAKLLQAKVDSLLLQYNQARNAYSMCRSDAQLDFLDPNVVCKTEKDTYLDLRRQYTEAVDAKDLADYDVLVKKREYNNAKDLTAQKELDYLNRMARLEQLMASAENIRATANSYYREYAPMRGIDAQMVYSVRWGDLVNEYRQLNPDINIPINKVPIKYARVFASAKVDSPTTPGSQVTMDMPVLLSAEIPGLLDQTTFQPVDAAAGPEVPAEPLKPLDLDNTHQLIGMGDSSFSGRITLSLVGACPYFPQGANTDVAALSYDDLSAYLVVNAIYQYPVQARRRYKATYNLAQLVTRMERKTQKGGFFRRKNIHEIIETNETNDWFDIEFFGDDPEFCYTAEEQTRITNEVKEEKIMRALDYIAMMYGDGKISTPPVPDLPKDTGAGYIANQLLEQKPWYVSAWRRGYIVKPYAYAAGYILKGLDSVFGRKTAVSNFKRSNNVTMVEDVKQIKILLDTTGITFTK